MIQWLYICKHAPGHVHQHNVRRHDALILKGHRAPRRFHLWKGHPYEPIGMFQGAPRQGPGALRQLASVASMKYQACVHSFYLYTFSVRLEKYEIIWVRWVFFSANFFSIWSFEPISHKKYNNGKESKLTWQRVKTDWGQRSQNNHSGSFHLVANTWYWTDAKWHYKKKSTLN